MLFTQYVDKAKVNAVANKGYDYCRICDSLDAEIEAQIRLPEADWKTDVDELKRRISHVRRAFNALNDAIEDSIVSCR